MENKDNISFEDMFKQHEAELKDKKRMKKLAGIKNEGKISPKVTKAIEELESFVNKVIKEIDERRNK
jgi:hypothetical protein